MEDRSLLGLLAHSKAVFASFIVQLFMARSPYTVFASRLLCSCFCADWPLLRLPAAFGFAHLVASTPFLSIGNWRRTNNRLRVEYTTLLCKGDPELSSFSLLPSVFFRSPIVLCIEGPCSAPQVTYRKLGVLAWS